MSENKEKQQATTNPNSDGPAEADDAADRTDGYPAEGEKGDRRRKAGVIILLLLALALAGFGGFMLWKSQQPDLDPGTSIQQTSGKTTKEIQEELDEIANKSRMTISVAPTVQLKGHRARVNVINVEDNKFDQKFTLSQGGKTIYESGIVKTGHKVEWCAADGLTEGTATLTVQAVNKKTSKASGNPQSVEVKVTTESVK